MSNIQFIMTCHNSVPGYGEMDQIIFQREIYVGGEWLKTQTESKLLSTAFPGYKRERDMERQLE